MRSDTRGAPAAERKGLFARLIGGLRDRIRRLFGKKSDGPNIYPFF
ncbi:MAG TPA: hypothetical protein VN848_03685 [Gemmatimonadales bacterium]|nr:hypothetical protein [Gemmatimonadales bacterium]